MQVRVVSMDAKIPAEKLVGAREQDSVALWHLTPCRFLLVQHNSSRVGHASAFLSRRTLRTILCLRTTARDYARMEEPAFYNKFMYTHTGRDQDGFQSYS